MINRLLVANRGEIALRIMRTCREMGIETVGLYGPDETDAPHLSLADRAVEVATSDFLDSDRLVALAQDCGADALHPGYGFLSESPDLPRRCEERGVLFVGPSSASVERMADKTTARAVAESAGVPTLPSLEDTDDPVAIERFGDKVGWPLIVKAASGGGGRATQVIDSRSEAQIAITDISNRAAKLFASPTVYIEKYLVDARHIEVQVFADRYGSAVALGTRDCSVQRRRQKLVEEAPASGISDDLARQLERAAVAVTKAVSYENAGTVEFLVAGESFYFLEMNTRIQVEHTVTEQVFGLDLVRAQLEVASGEPLSSELTESSPRGHAIELRINAEDPRNKFMPSLGAISSLQFPDTAGIRVDEGYAEGQLVTASYDGLIAKLIAWGPTRREAIDRLHDAIAETRVEGVGTTLELGRRICADRDFQTGSVSTDWLERTMTPRFLSDCDRLPPEPVYPDTDWSRHGVVISGRFHRLPLTPASRRASRPTRVHSTPGDDASTHASGGLDLDVRSPMQGSVTAVYAEIDQQLGRGQTVCVIEAMKLENHVAAAISGVVDEILVDVGDQVRAGQVVARLRPPDEPTSTHTATDRTEGRSTSR